ncbi:CoA transferase [Paracoccus jiaweipingae]|uniref:CoA transferase n=1 Tax=unclassified Paracoccus (in: a-proteobacteria) TaxID=2688777 RepID=UPI00379F581C
MAAMDGMRVICIASNVPGPAAAGLLAAEGAQVIKVEPPFGDYLQSQAPGWYDELNAGFDIRRIDLRSPDGWAAFTALLTDADVLISSHRRAALTRLGITVPALAQIAPQLCWVEVVGDTDAPDIPGHDLTYQAEAGLLAPPAMPRSLFADLAGVQAAARAALALLMGRGRGDACRHRAVGLRQAALGLTAPLRHGVTAPGGFLSGARPEYRIYALRDGWVAMAALEPHFHDRFRASFGDDPAVALAALTRAQVDDLARARDIPLCTLPAD